MHNQINIKERGLIILLLLLITYLFLSLLLYSEIRQYFWNNFYENLSLGDFHTRFNIERNEDRLIIISEGILFLVFISGFYNVIIEYIRSKATLLSFIEGLKMFIPRVMFIGLLVYLMVAIVSILVFVIYMIFQMLIWKSSIYISASVEGLYNLLYYSIMFSIFYPLVIFWFPSLFADNVGVFESLKRSIKKGKENYWVFFLLGMSYSIYKLAFYYTVNGGEIPVTSSMFDIIWGYNSKLYPIFQAFIVVMQFVTVFLAFRLYESNKNINIKIRSVLKALKRYDF